MIREFLKRRRSTACPRAGDRRREPKQQGPFATHESWRRPARRVQHPRIASPAIRKANRHFARRSEILCRKISLARDKTGPLHGPQFSSPRRASSTTAPILPSPRPASRSTSARRPHRSDRSCALRAALRRHASLRALRKLARHRQARHAHRPSRACHVRARYSMSREPGNVAGMHLYSFGGAVRTATWMRELIAGR